MCDRLIGCCSSRKGRNNSDPLWPMRLKRPILSLIWRYGIGILFYLQCLFRHELVAKYGRLNIRIAGKINDSPPPPPELLDMYFRHYLCLDVRTDLLFFITAGIRVISLYGLAE